MSRYLLTPEAKDDLNEIRRYLTAEADSGVARFVLTKVRSTITMLARTPGIGHLREDLTEHPVKFWQVFSYLVVYDPVSRPINVIRVLHSKRDVSGTLTDDD